MSKYYQNQGNRNNYQQNQQQFKKSGATFKMMDGMPIISAWRKTKGGLSSLYARPYKNSSWRVGKENGNETINLFVTITTGTHVYKGIGWYQKKSGKLTIKELGLVVSPNGSGQTRSGKLAKGFFGRIR